MEQAKAWLQAVATPPSSDGWRRAQHVACLLAAGYVVTKAVALGPSGVLKAVLTNVLPALEAVPGVGALVKAEEEKALKDIEIEMLGDGDETALVSLPDAGRPASDVLAAAGVFEKADLNDEAKTKKWGGIYHVSTADHEDPLFELQGQLFNMFNATNALYPMVFKGVRKFQAEIVTMIIDMVAEKDASGKRTGGEVGLLTSGGTESICLAVYALKKFAKVTKGISEPELICCNTAHGAVDKACAYFDVKLIKLLPGSDFRMVPADVKAALNRNTIGVYTSAPTFPHGVFDPIEEIAGICKEVDVPVHVDNCMGGIVASMARDLGLLSVPFDFNVPGVTTISVDCHKFGQASKGASVVAFRDNAVRQCTYTPVLDWSGGFYVTPTMQGSRNGAIIAAAWGTLVHKGRDGYQAMAKTVVETTQKGIAGINAIEGLKVPVQPDLCMLPFMWDSDEPAEQARIYAVASGMSKKGWTVATLQKPACANITVAEQYVWTMDAFLADLAAVVADVASKPIGKLTGAAGVYGSAAVMPDDKLEGALKAFCDMQMRVKPKAPGGASAE